MDCYLYSRHHCDAAESAAVQTPANGKSLALTAPATARPLPASDFNDYAADEPDARVFNHDKKFDLDLNFGQRAELWAYLLPGLRLLEIKCERNHWERTGNAFLEFECNGQPSGFRATQAHLFGIVFYSPERKEHVGMFIVRARELRHNLRRLCREKKASIVDQAGDGGKVKGVLLPLARLYELLANIATTPQPQPKPTHVPNPVSQPNDFAGAF